MAKETYHTHQRDAVGRVLEERQRGMRMRKCQGLLGLFCVSNRSLLPYGRPLLTYCTHKRDAVGRVLEERQRGMRMRKCQKRPVKRGLPYGKRDLLYLYAQTRPTDILAYLEERQRALLHTLCEFVRALHNTLSRLVEEILHPCPQIVNQATFYSKTKEHIP